MKILKIESLAAHKGREVMEKQREADDHTIFFGKDDLSGFLHKDGVVNRGFVGNDFIGAFFVSSQLLDKFENQAGFGFFGRADGKVRFNVGPSTGSGTLTVFVKVVEPVETPFY
jgi:hypothetical protein